MSRTRLSLDIDPKAKAQLDAVQMRTGAPSMTDAIKRALAVLDIVTEHQEQGGKIILRDKDGNEETIRLL